MKHCLITGATGGLGTGLARAFWESGACLLLVGRDAAATQRLCASLAPRPGQWARSLAADLAQPGVAGQVIDWARSTSQRLDVLINNAAIQGPIGVLWENDWEEWLATLQVDFVAPAALCRQAAPWMIAAGGGSIINLGGGGASAARARFSAYASAKTALVRFSETLAEELRPHGVTVNCVAPGVLPTAMLAKIIARGAEATGAEEHARALAASDSGEAVRNAAELCVFLASDSARGITGRFLSAAWDPWRSLPAHRSELADSDIYTLRRIVPRDRGLPWGESP
jgi:3-oxoacyl-[acyl-carrier protein] reductase